MSRFLLQMRRTATRKELTELFSQNQQAVEAIEKAKFIRGQLLPYQALALFHLTQPYNKPGTRVLEIGTFHGYSTAIMAQAMPLAEIITLNPSTTECKTARKNLEQWSNVTVIEAVSWEYLATYDEQDEPFSVIFVDGDHNRIGRDMPWWDHLAHSGLMLFHDYSPLVSGVVYATVNRFVDSLGRQLDIMLMDDDKLGMAGIYKR